MKNIFIIVLIVVSNLNLQAADRFELIQKITTEAVGDSCEKGTNNFANCFGIAAQDCKSKMVDAVMSCARDMAAVLPATIDKKNFSHYNAAFIWCGTRRYTEKHKDKIVQTEACKNFATPALSF